MEEQTEQQGKSKVWIWILIIVILLAIGACIYFWLSGDSSSVANGASSSVGNLNNAASSGNVIPSPPAFPA